MSLNYSVIRAILKKPRLFGWGLVSIIYLVFSLPTLGEFSFFLGFLIYILSLAVIKKVVLALFSYELRKKHLPSYERRIKNVFLINLPIFLVLIGLRNIYFDNNFILFGYLFILIIVYFILVYFSLKKKKIPLHPSFILFIFLGNIFTSVSIPIFVFLLLVSLF